MSEVIRDFFTRYNAVPANDYGPIWEQATDGALIGWAEMDKATWKQTPESRPHLEPRMVRVYRELDKRREAAEMGSDRRFDLAQACGWICGCIGGVRLYDLLTELER